MLSQWMGNAMGPAEGLSGKHRKVLEAVFTDPVSGSVAWRDIEALFLGLIIHYARKTLDPQQKVTGPALSAWKIPRPVASY